MNAKFFGLIVIVMLAGATGWVFGNNKQPPHAEYTRLSDGTTIEYGTVIVDTKWKGDKTDGAATVTFKTPFVNPPMVIASQYGRGGWHFFVHTRSTKDQAFFAVMLDRSFQGKEPRMHPCQIAYMAIGRTAK